jgi:hypothetical protein
MSDGLGGYWLSRFVFERALALIYLVAFVCTANQFIPLLGEHGLLPASRFIRIMPFRSSPSLFHLSSTDATFRAAAWLGAGLSCLALAGVMQRSAVAAAAVWTGLWVLYLSFVNVGQVFYAFGWESLLLETGFFAIFLGGRTIAPSGIVIWILRSVLFRVMFGAGLIKLCGDPCWRDLTCLNYYFETQPIPNGLSWYFHWLPAGVHSAGVLFNHLVELCVSFLYFMPQPIALSSADRPVPPAAGLADVVCGHEPTRGSSLVYGPARKAPGWRSCDARSAEDQSLSRSASISAGVVLQLSLHDT